ncbi:unnamed protein product [Peronospora belbahrii]|uniref:Elicitin n=1 Tax=Peronospora belbahrii TaxID=622444 RepID=A0ABN8DB64_9STRA|nr:unnamed protein product [Peronospora belbahrii]
MKTTFYSTLILSAAVVFVSVATAPCNTAALSQLTVTGNVRTCHADSGYSLTSLAIPRDAQITAICESDACKESINALKQVAPNECTIGPLRLYADVINPLSQRCGTNWGSGSLSAPGSGPMDGDVGSASACASMSGSAIYHPHTSTPQPNTRPNSGPPSSTPTPAPGNGGADAPTLSTCSATAVLATVVAALL